MSPKYRSKNNPRVIIIQKLYGKFYNQDEFFQQIKKHNFENISYRNLSSGIVAIHSAWKV